MNEKENETHNKFEVFRSPPYVYNCLFDKFPQLWRFDRDILDPSAGDGRMVMELVKRGSKGNHLLIDIREEERETLEKTGVEYKIGNFLEVDIDRKFDFIITNPPFSLSIPFIEKSKTLLKKNGVIMILQRLNWLGTYKRSKWLKDESDLSNVLIIPKRPIWEIDGRPNNRSSTYEYAWFCFMKEEPYEMPTIDWLI